MIVREVNKILWITLHGEASTATALRKSSYCRCCTVSYTKYIELSNANVSCLNFRCCIEWRTNNCYSDGSVEAGSHIVLWLCMNYIHKFKIRVNVSRIFVYIYYRNQSLKQFSWILNACMILVWIYTMYVILETLTQ